MPSYQYTRAPVGSLWDISNPRLCNAVRLSSLAANFTDVSSGIDLVGDPDETAVLVTFSVALSPSEILTLDALVASVLGQQLTSAQCPSNFCPPDYNAAFGNLRVRNITTGTAFGHTHQVPADFLELVALYVRVVPNGTNPGRAFAAAATWAVAGEPENSHPGNAVVGYDAVGSRQTDLDISAAVPGLLAGATIGITLTNTDGPTLSVVGTILVYKSGA